MKKNETILRDAPLENASLMSHLRTMSSECRKTGMTRLKNMRKAMRQLSLSLAMLRVRGDGYELTPAAVWLADNARVIEEACVTVREELKTAASLPASHGEARVALLAREWLSHVNAQATGDALIQAAEAWQRAHPLTEAELCLLPLAVKQALLLLLTELAVSCAKAEQERTRAEATLQITSIQMSDAYWERLSCLLQEQEDLDALAKLDARLAEQGTSAAEVAEREHERQTRECLWTSNAIASLRIISSLDFRDGHETLSAMNRWLRNDPTGIYPRMDFTSRSMYRQRAAKLAKAFRVAESTVARKTIECAENEAGDTIPELSRHVGYYLMDEGQPALWESLGTAPFALRASRAIGRCASILYIVLIFLGSTGIAALLWLLGVKSVLVAPALLVAGEGFRQVIGLLIHHLSPPRRIARIAPDQLDDCEVLVAVPTLLTSRAHALEMVRHLSVLRLANPEKKLSFMLLADFQDASAETLTEDEGITEAALSGIAALNEVWNGGFYYLHRAREWNEKAGKFIGHERKRGALVALNEILLHGSCKTKIAASSCAPLEWTNRFDYVVTLDADTQLPPGSALTLAGMLQHPLNRPWFINGKRRGMSVLQPRMETSASTIHTRIARVWGGDGGFDPYITAFSDIYQNLCGEGSFAGKGIYHVRSFYEGTQGKIRDNSVLSHDLLEGGLVGSTLVCDLALYDSQPATLSSWMKRLHRWTRGDWQLLGWLLPVVKGKDGWFKNPLSMLNQYKIYDNLRRSLVPLASVVLYIFSVWRQEPAAFCAALLLPHVRMFMPPSRKSFAASITHLALMPYEAAGLTDAILRTLFRLLTGKKLLEWVPAAQAERQSQDSLLQFWPNGLCALALLAVSIKNPWWLIGTVPLSALWACAPLVKNWLNAKEKPSFIPTEAQKEFLLDVAQKTFRFFEETVSLETNHLPPDNLQIEPAIGLTKRTSPTNIGMYLLACVSVCELGLLDADGMAIRVEKTIATLEKMDKWNGHLFNWYDTESLAPLSNRYVSSVDSGNLVGCLLLTAQSLRSHLEEVDAHLRELSSRVDALAAAMDFSLLYDQQKDLFTIGIHADTGERDTSYYDLLASEARLLSYIALMRREVPVRHWRSMGRTMTKTRKGAALLSWSGTMFEYLLPSLFLRSPHGTLLGDTCLYAALEQIGVFENQPWGISESGYYAFDRMLAYQYKAFGLPRLALKNATIDQVITPYASALSLSWIPNESIENLMKMAEMGWLSDFGFYEAIDYNEERLPEGYDFKVVQSHMSHHQGMIIASICNLLTDGALSGHFHSLPQVEAYTLFLEERKPTRSMLRASSRIHKSDPIAKPPRSIARHASKEFFPFDAHAMYGNGTTMVVDARGFGYLSHNGLMLTRYRPDPLYENGVLIYLRFANGKVFPINLESEVIFDRSRVLYQSTVDGLEIELTCFVSPLDGSAIHMLRLHALPEHAVQVEVASFFEVCLSTQAADESHPVFQNLGIETKRLMESAIIAKRRDKKKEEKAPNLVHALLSEEMNHVQMETSRMAFLGRGENLVKPKALRAPVGEAAEGEFGAVLDPCMSLRAGINIQAGETVVCWFLTAAVADEQKANALLAQYATCDPVRRALELAIAQDEVTASYLGLEPVTQLTALKMLPWLIARLAGPEGSLQARSVLWQFGISGDNPIIVAQVFSDQQLSFVRSVVKAHAYLRAIGVWSDLVLVVRQEEGYFQPLRDALNALLAGGPSRNLLQKGGGIYLLNGQELHPDAMESLFSHAALMLNGGEGTLAAQLARQRKQFRPAATWETLEPMERTTPHAGMLALENGFGGFRSDGGYVQHTQSPMPWCNVLANESFGTIVSDRGTGFTYFENSRLKRVTPFASDPVRDQRGENLFIRDESTGQYASPFDGALVTHGFGFSRNEANLLGVVAKLDVFVDDELPVKCQLLELYNPGEENLELSVTAFARFVLGSHIDDAAQVRCEIGGSAIFAISPAFSEPVFFAMPGRDAEVSFDGASFFGAGGATRPRGMLIKHLEHGAGGVPTGILRSRLTLQPKDTQTICILLGTGDYPSVSRMFREGGAQLRLAHGKIVWQSRQKALRPLVPDPAFSVLVGGWFPYQALSARIFAHAGFYQAGGAIGFRDQLQDMLAFVYTNPERVRSHVLDAAAHQFEDGDVQHWWHPETTGVRTRITDDRLFLPYVTAAYLRVTEDVSILEEMIPYLRNEEIPAGHEDWYGEAKYGDIIETLHSHNLRAIESVQLGAHGLPLIGGGDWNDGMNQIGVQGMGESVWLGLFLCKVIDDYSPYCQMKEQMRLQTKRRQLAEAVEAHAWDGEWYIRAWFDNDDALGSHECMECQIDLLVQAWAVLTGAKHAKRAFLSAMDRLVDRKDGIIKLLDPPFDGHFEPGYIRAYPPGIRENGGQYTHAACWFIMACVKLGMTELAWDLFFMILPTSHSKDFASASRYRVEPYVAAADVSAGAHTGRGGWTWYTGSATLLYLVAMECLLGFEKRGNRVRLKPTAPASWEGYTVEYRYGSTLYILRAVRGMADDGWIEMVDDGLVHEQVYALQ